jgi:hypothetical protein
MPPIEDLTRMFSNDERSTRLCTCHPRRAREKGLPLFLRGRARESAGTAGGLCMCKAALFKATCVCVKRLYSKRVVYV